MVCNIVAWRWQKVAFKINVDFNTTTTFGFNNDCLSCNIRLCWILYVTMYTYMYNADVKITDISYKQNLLIVANLFQTKPMQYTLFC